MYFILPFALWPILFLSGNYIFSKIYNYDVSLKLTRNMLGFVDATTCCLGFLGYYLTNENKYLEYSVIVPISYYIWDTYVILVKDLKNEYPYVYHHIIALMMLNEIYNDSVFSSQVMPVLVAAELGNIPLYYSYHMIKSYPVNPNDIIQSQITNLKKHISAKFFQIVSFFIIRILFFSYYIYGVYNKIDKSELFKLVLLSIYFIGIFWLFNQIKGYRKDIHNLSLLTSSIVDKINSSENEHTKAD